MNTDCSDGYSTDTASRIANSTDVGDDDAETVGLLADAFGAPRGLPAKDLFEQAVRRPHVAPRSMPPRRSDNMDYQPLPQIDEDSGVELSGAGLSSVMNSDGEARAGGQARDAGGRDVTGPSFNLFTMSPGDVRLLMRQERGQLQEELVRRDDAAPSSRQPEENEEEGSSGKLVIDPCLGRCEVLQAKFALGFVLLAGVLGSLLAFAWAHKWLGGMFQAKKDPAFQASLLLTVVLPVILVAFLCVLEHSEWMYVRRVSPQTQLRYTPVMHDAWPAFRDKAIEAKRSLRAAIRRGR